MTACLDFQFLEYVSVLGKVKIPPLRNLIGHNPWKTDFLLRLIIRFKTKLQQI